MPTLPAPARCLRFALTLAAALLLLGALAAPAAAAPPAPEGGGDPAAIAEGYLLARAAATVTADPAATLAPWLVPGSRLARHQSLLASGTAKRHLTLGHLVDDVRCDVTLQSLNLDPSGVTAFVHVHELVKTTWHAADGPSEEEAAGLDHTLTLRRTAAGWRVVGDRCADTLGPALLEAAGAGRGRVSAAAAALERASAGRRPEPPAASEFELEPSDAVPRLPALRAIYPEVIYYDRAGAQAYADRYALNYNSTYIRFSADCCNYASQCAKAGDMPEIRLSTVTWWYDKEGTSSPSDDSWSASWPWVPSQMSSWAGRRISWVSSVSYVTRGDFIYYDWTGNGSWDHVAVCVGTNSLGQKIIDAHTTDHYHVYWKLGTSTTTYKFARVYTKW